MSNFYRADLLARQGKGGKMQKLIKLVLVLIGALSGYVAHLLLTSGQTVLSELESAERNKLMLMLMLCGALVGLLLAIIGSGIVKGLTRRIYDKMQKVTLYDFFIAASGIIIGLVVATLISMPVQGIPAIGSYVALALNVILASLGMVIAVSLKDDISTRMAGTIAGGGPGRIGGFKQFTRTSAKILDTSSVIDGRILDIARSGFLDGTLIMTEFIINELQRVADSPDQFKRVRGRRGLDVLQRMRDDESIDLRIMAYPQEETEIDQSLVKLARSIGAAIVTTDYNLNKAATLQGVVVLNVNELSNAVKPIVLPGEDILVTVIKEGKEHGQGVGYLDDGTMIVVEGGKRLIGSEALTTVTSVLQTAAGRLIFTKVKEGMSANGQ